MLCQLPAPETIATSDVAAKLAAADAAVANIQQLLGEIRISDDELRRTFNDLKRIATSGAGGPSGLQSGDGGRGSRADDDIE